MQWLFWDCSSRLLHQGSLSALPSCLPVWHRPSAPTWGAHSGAVRTTSAKADETCQTDQHSLTHVPGAVLTCAPVADWQRKSDCWHAERLAGHLQGADEQAGTRELAAAAPGLAKRLLRLTKFERSQRGLPVAGSAAHTGGPSRLASASLVSKPALTGTTTPLVCAANADASAHSTALC